MHKNIILTICLAAITFIAEAQTSDHPSFGFRAGINFQNINGKDENGDKLSNKIVPRFHIGVNAELPIATDFYVQPGLLFSTKGAKSTEPIGGQPADQKLNLSYLEVPVNLLYKPVLGKGKLILGFGPYIAFGLAGSVKTEGSGQTATTDVKFKNTVKPSDPAGKAYFKPVDAGANLLFGYELSNKWSAQLNAQLGLTKINPSNEGASNDKSSWKNTGFGVSIGYRL